MLAIVIIVSLGIIFFSSALKSRFSVVVWMVFFSAWYGVDVDVGLRVTAFLLVTVALSAVTIIYYIKGQLTSSSVAGRGLLLLFIFWSVLSTLVQLPFLPEATVEGGWLRSPVPRGISQLVMLILTIAPAFIIPMAVRNYEQLVILGKAYLLSVAVLAVIGFIQLIIWYGTGVDPLPIGFVNDLLGGFGETRQGYYEYGNLSINRMSSLGGEPKNLAGALVFGLILIQVILSSASIIVNRLKIISVWILLAIALVATAATTGYILWFVGTLAIVASSSIVLAKSESSALSYGAIRTVGFVTLGLVLIGLIGEMAGVPITELVLDRTISRFWSTEYGVFEDFDDGIIAYLLAHPIHAIAGVGIGNIHLYADSYLRGEVAIFGGGTAFVAKAQYLRYISEIGVVGIGLFSIWSFRLYFLLKIEKKIPSNPIDPQALASFWLASIMLYFAAGAGGAQFFVSAGIISAYLSISRRNSRSGI
jgi:hypothetical protein